MQYYELNRKRFFFIVTPEELCEVLKGFHHVVMNTGVPRDYVESDPQKFLRTYESLYARLKAGERLVWKEHYSIVSFSTGITAHLENCTYRFAGKLCVPDFPEPCPFLQTFCFLPFQGQIATSFGVSQFPENVCGLQLSFPGKVICNKDTPKHPAGTVPCEVCEDWSTYETLTARIKEITKPLKFEFDGKIRRPAVRISAEAKEAFRNFCFVTSNNISVLRS